jgi:antitoxin component YwqK of YwqJK toxin-antitoxin module
MHGECFSFYDDGRVCSKSFYINGKLHGEFISFYENGQVLRQCLLNDDVYHGEYITYYGNGQVGWHRLFVNGNVLIDLKKSPVCNEEKMLLSLQYGVGWI